MNIPHICAATALAVALLTSYVIPTNPATVTKEAAPACMTEKVVMGKVKGQKPRFDLKDEELKAFNANFKQSQNRDAPAHVDRIMVWGEGEGEDDTLLFVAFSKGCVTSAQFIPANVFLKIYYGNRA